MYKCPASIDVLHLFGGSLNPVGFYNQTPVMRCALYNADGLELLLSLNADTTKKNRDGKTALQLAENDDEIVQLLSDHEKRTVTNKKEWILFCF